MVRITVEASSNYDVLIAEGLLGETGSLAAEVVPPCKVLVASDDIVTALYSDTVVHSLQDAGFEVEQFTFPHGEKSKNLQTLNSPPEYAAKKQLTRQSLFVALGGGITGDLTGFAAAVSARSRLYRYPQPFWLQSIHLSEARLQLILTQARTWQERFSAQAGYLRSSDV